MLLYYFYHGKICHLDQSLSLLKTNCCPHDENIPVLVISVIKSLNEMWRGGGISDSRNGEVIPHSIFSLVISVFPLVIYAFMSVFSLVISVFPLVIYAFMSVFSLVISVFPLVIYAFMSVFSLVISVFPLVIYAFISVFSLVISVFSLVISVFSLVIYAFFTTSKIEYRLFTYWESI